jgi:TRAP transporter 4TM/12TM fusion protein
MGKARTKAKGRCPIVDIQPMIKKDEGESSFRRLHGLLGGLVKIIGAGGCLFFLLYIAGVFSYARIYFFENQYNAIFMAIVLTLTFLLVPAGKGSPRDSLPWYDLLFILITLVGCMYIIINARELNTFGKISATNFEIALGAATTLVLMEAVRRSFGWAMVGVVVAFLFYAKLGYLVPGRLNLYYFSWEMLASDVYLSSQGIFGSLTSISSGIIIAFIAFGVFFVAAGGGEFFMKLALAFTGSMTGGPAKAAIVGSALFGTISGSPSANVVVTGSVTIPLMKSLGYKAHYAGAVEAVASTGGALTPPIMSGVAFIMAQMLGKPYAYIATIAALPAFLYYLSLYTQVHLQAVKLGLRGLPPEQLPSLKSSIKEGWEFAIPFVALVLFLFFLNYQAEIAGLYTILVLIIVSIFRKEHRININKFLDSLEGGLRSTLAVANIIALAGIIQAVLGATGLGPKISADLVTFFGGSSVLLVIAAGIACYIMGMGISFIAIYVLVTVLLVPALAKLGLPHVVSHFFIMYMVLATNFTPPYCTAAYVAASIAKAHPFRIGFQSMKLGIVTFLVPFIIVLNPALLLIGKPGVVIFAAITAIIGIVGLSAGLEGYLFSKMNWAQRILFMVGGTNMVIPGMVTDLIGAGLLALAGFWQWKTYKDTVAVAPGVLN